MGHRRIRIRRRDSRCRNQWPGAKPTHVKTRCDPSHHPVFDRHRFGNVCHRNLCRQLSGDHRALGSGRSNLATDSGGGTNGLPNSREEETALIGLCARRDSARAHLGNRPGSRNHSRRADQHGVSGLGDGHLANFRRMDVRCEQRSLEPEDSKIESTHRWCSKEQSCLCKPRSRHAANRQLQRRRGWHGCDSRQRECRPGNRGVLDRFDSRRSVAWKSKQGQVGAHSILGADHFRLPFGFH